MCLNRTILLFIHKWIQESVFCKADILDFLPRNNRHSTTIGGYLSDINI